MQEKFLPEQRKLSRGENHSPTVRRSHARQKLRQMASIVETFRAECFSVYAGRTACIFLR